VYIDGVSSGWDAFAPYQEAYKHIWWTEAVASDGHGGTDWLELKLFVDAVRNRTQTPLDVYDSVVMSCIVPLSGDSIAQGSAPVKVPDFTRGQWRTRQPCFALDPRTFRRPGADAVVRTDDGKLSQTVQLGLGSPRIELPGVSLRLVGDPKPFSGWPATANQPCHCLFSEADWGLELTVPKGTTGIVAAYAYDPEGLRRQSVVFQDRKPDELQDFTKGIWLEYPFTAEESQSGLLRLAVQRQAGANCVLSRLRVAIASPP
jgi:hypothetical protein